MAGLGQYMDVGAQAGYAFDIQAMFDRVAHPARGRGGGANGAATVIAQDDGTAMKGKGKQSVPMGRVVQMAFPGGAGYGHAADRKGAAVRRDLACGYITKDTAVRSYGLSVAEAEDILTRAARGEVF